MKWLLWWEERDLTKRMQKASRQQGGLDWVGDHESFVAHVCPMLWLLYSSTWQVRCAQTAALIPSWIVWWRGEEVRELRIFTRPGGSVGLWCLDWVGETGRPEGWWGRGTVVKSLEVLGSPKDHHLSVTEWELERWEDAGREIVVEFVNLVVEQFLVMMEDQGVALIVAPKYLRVFLS